MPAQLKYVRFLLLHPSSLCYSGKMDPFPYPDGWYADWYFVCHRSMPLTCARCSSGSTS